MKNPGDQIPILKFLNRHKWRIMLPLLFALLFWAIPRYQSEIVAVQQTLFIKSDVYSESDLRQEVANIQGRVLSDEFLTGLISKYDLYKTGISEYTKIEKIRTSVEVRVEDQDVIGGAAILVWAHFRVENSEHVTEVARDLAAPFETVQGFHIEKFETRPYDANPYRQYVFFGSLLQGFFLIMIPLILLWELPNLVYSTKTKETVFEPLKADWQDELYDARLNGQTIKAAGINIKYSVAFVSAMLQRSPVGDAIEHIKKLAL